MTQWFSLHHFPLAKLRSFALAKLGRPCELIKAAATRFGTNTLVGERLLKLKGALQATCTDEEYVAMKYADKGNEEEETGAGRIIRSNKGATASRLCLDNSPTGFWARVGRYPREGHPADPEDAPSFRHQRAHHWQALLELVRARGAL